MRESQEGALVICIDALITRHQYEEFKQWYLHTSNLPFVLPFIALQPSFICRIPYIVYIGLWSILQASHQFNYLVKFRMRSDTFDSGSGYRYPDTQILMEARLS